MPRRRQTGTDAKAISLDTARGLHCYVMSPLILKSSCVILDKLESIRGAVAHQVYEEENNWFADFKNKVPLSEQIRLTTRYMEEFTRSVRANVDIHAVLFEG